MFIALYTSRVILEALGEVDFGVYNVVAGVSVSFVFFSATLATSTQRFLSYEIGRGNQGRVRRVFSVSFWTMCAVAAVVIIVGFATGPWLVYDVLNIPPDRKAAALIVFFSMIVAMGIMLVFTVFEAVLIARENMKIYAYIGILDAVMKLTIAYVVMVAPEKLITYGLLMVVALLMPKLIMLLYCRRHYPESLPERVWDVSRLKVFLRFVGWNIYEGLVWVINSEGINVVLNIFFGPIVNAARGVTQQVNGAVVNFAINFFTAVRPQIVKSYAAGKFEEARQLLYMGSRGSFFIIWVLCLPIIIRAPYVLSLWLVEVPEYTVVFIRWTFAFLLVNSLQPPTAALTQATGELKRFMMISMNAYLVAFPTAAIVLALGGPAWSVYPVLIIARFVSILLGLYTLRPFVLIRYRDYTLKVLLPILAVTVATLVVSEGFNSIIPDTFLGLVIFAIISVVTTLVAIAFIGLTRSERAAAFAKIKTLLSKFR